jgi:hypothetical protein
MNTAQDPSAASNVSNVIPNIQPNSQSQESQKAPQVQDVKSLVLLGRIEESFDDFGFTWHMHSLNSSENSDAMAAVQHLDGLAQINQLRIEVLSRAIDTINSQPLEVTYTGDPKTNTIAKKREIVGSWQPTVLNKLFEKYSSLVDRSNKTVNGDLGN